MLVFVTFLFDYLDFCFRRYLGYIAGANQTLSSNPATHQTILYSKTKHTNLSIAYLFIAPSEYCSPPPTIENTNAGYTNKVPIGDSVLYSCKEGYQRMSGDVKLKCFLTNDYSVSWTGNRLQCANEGNIMKTIF